jgi:HD superfamily phosphohydrolase
LAKNPHRTFEIRCPVHGFIQLDDWERDVIEQPAFQRLRRIKQLAFTDYVYPGATHTRFEHSLGVMHTATQLYDSIRRKCEPYFRRELAYNNEGFERDRRLVRFAALLHDVGHAPFSHSSDDLFPLKPDGKTRYKHEEYSAAIIRSELRGAIEDHKLNENTELTANKVAALVEGSPAAKRALFWRVLISSQMDADRMDYLLRDSHHIGVGYGKFDLLRLISCATAMQVEETPLGIEEGGQHAAEALVLARYFMFTQVYFHKTRVAFDLHLREAMKLLLPGGTFPPPTEAGLKEFLTWDDWTVQGLFKKGEGGEHAKRILERNHYREIRHSREVSTPQDLEEVQKWREKLGDLLVAEESARKSWYKTDLTDIPVALQSGDIKPLSELSTAIKNLQEINQVKLYVDRGSEEEAEKRLAKREGN